MSMRAIKSRSLGRLQLLEWLNAFLECDYSRVEHLKDGIAFAQVLDAVNPGKAGLSRLKFNASTQEECEHNLRVFEKALLSCKVHKELDIPRLAKGTFQHTFELLQWCYEYLHTHYPDADYKYRAYERRQLAIRKQMARRARRAGGGSVRELVSNPNLVPKSYSIAPGVKKTPPRDVVLAGGSSPGNLPAANKHHPTHHRRRLPSTSPTSSEDAYRLRSLTDEFEQMLMEASKDGFTVPQSPGAPMFSPSHRDSLRPNRGARGGRDRDAWSGSTSSPSRHASQRRAGADARSGRPRGSDNVGSGHAAVPAGDVGVEASEFDDLVLVLQRDLTKRVAWQQNLESRLLQLREERNNVFSALRGIERLCQSVGRGQDVSKKLLEVLHTSPEAFAQSFAGPMGQARQPVRAASSEDARRASLDHGDSSPS